MTYYEETIIFLYPKSDKSTPHRNSIFLQNSL